MEEQIEAALEPWDELSALVAAGQGEALGNFLQLLAPEDTAYTITRLSEDTRSSMFQMLAEVNPDLAADLMEHFADEQAAQIIEDLPTEAAAAIVDEMDSDEQTDVLSELTEADAEAILDRMDEEEAADVRDRLQYEADTAGGLMITEYLAFHEENDVDDVIRELRQNVDELNEYEVRYVYVTSPAGQLRGVVTMRTLVMSPRGKLLSQLMLPEPTVARADTSLDDLQDLYDRIDLTAVPVVDDEQKLVGVLQRAAVQEALSEEASEALAKFGGIIGGEELRTMSTFSRALRRLAFLIPIMFLLLMSATIISMFESTIEEVPIIAAFLPLVAGLCGAGGSQAVAVSIRELSLGLVKPTDFFRVLWKEATVAFLMGVVLGGLLFTISLLWKGDVHLAMVVGFALPFVLVMASCVGGAVPVFLHATPIDPAMASGPAVTTFVDIFGFFTVLVLTMLLVVGAAAVT